MIAGEYTGMRVQEAKSLIRSKLLELGQAVVYSEPEKKVMSRSGDECVVALTDQWYLTYGESSWRKDTEECLANMSLYSDEARHGFEHTLSWLNQWVCSRTFGLGTRIPWDEEFLVESLSDSTIYMAYYTVCHLLQKGEPYGSDTSSVKPEQLTDAIWDYVFLSGPEPKSSDIPVPLLEDMRQEFEYWYPFDLRVSGKDLIQNHLTFCIYNHTAIFPERHWPCGFRCNGHLMLDDKKMSKSTGNFKTLKEAIEKYSADATRFTLAETVDGMDDANFKSATADAAIVRLFKWRVWMEEVVAAELSLRVGPPCSYADRVFANEMNIAIKLTEKNYSNNMFREALKTGYHDLQTARDAYRYSFEFVVMNRDLVWRFMDIQTRLIAPICPHLSEYLLAKQGGPKEHTIGLIFVKEEYGGWQRECLGILRDKYDSVNHKFAPDQEILEAVQQSSVFGQQGNFKQTQKLCMPFLRYKKDEVMKLGVQALDLRLPFGEIEVLQDNLEVIKRQIGLEHVQVLSATNAGGFIKDDHHNHASILTKNPPSPGSPTPIFFTKEDGM
ncbi:hypothetical protein OROHE_019301 [Orobanche hederae]